MPRADNPFQDVVVDELSSVAGAAEALKGRQVTKVPPDPVVHQHATCIDDPVSPEILARPIVVAKAPRVSWKDWQNEKYTLGSILAKLTRFQRGPKDGEIITQGEIAGTNRTNKAVVANYFISFDCDTGETPEELVAHVDAVKNPDGAIPLSLIYSTHSSGTARTAVSDQAMRGYMSSIGREGVAPSVGDMRDYLVTVKKVKSRAFDNGDVLRDWSEPASMQHTADGVVYVIDHNPMRKSRVIQFFARPYVFADGVQADRILEWKERYAGRGEQLGLTWDEKCIDPARGFYTPRLSPGKPIATGDAGTGGADDAVIIVMGSSLVDWRQFPRVPVKGSKIISGSKALAKSNDYVPKTKNVREFVVKFGKGFDAGLWLESLTDKSRDANGGAVFECPLSDLHRKEPHDTFFVVDAAESKTNSGFTMMCQHQTCSAQVHEDRIGWLDVWCQQLGIEDAYDILDSGYVHDPETGEALTRAAAEPILIKGMMVPMETVSRLEELNAKHAFVGYGGRTRFLDVIDNPARYETPYQFLDAQTFDGLCSPMPSVAVKIKKQGEWVTVDKEIAGVWMKWSKRRTYRRVGFYPAKANAPADVFNLWEGWRIAPKPGCWHKMKKHIYEVICRRDAKKFHWFIDWLSHLVQTTGQPDKRSPTSPVVWGKKGGGKSICFDFVADIFGNHGMTVSRKEQLIGKFNKHLMMSLFVVAEEAVYAHDKQGEGPLKDLLTRKSLTIEPKNVDTFEAPNFCRFAFVSNEKLAVPMTEDERRFQPFEISPRRIGDKTWFNAIIEEMRNGGLEAMFHDLMTRTYDEGLIRLPLVGSADLNAMKAVTLEAPAKFLAHWIMNGKVVLTGGTNSLPTKCETPKSEDKSRKTANGFDFDEARASSSSDVLELTDSLNIVRSAHLKQAYDLWCRENLDTFELRKAVRSAELLAKDLREVLTTMSNHRTAKARGWCLPPLAECQAALAAHPVMNAYVLGLDGAGDEDKDSDADDEDDDAE